LDKAEEKSLMFPEEIAEAAIERFSRVETLGGLEEARIDYLGDKSSIQAAQKRIATLPAHERASFGKRVNEARASMKKAYEDAKRYVEARELEAKFQDEFLDVTLPGIKPNMIGSQHPLNLVASELVSIFNRLGFSLIEGPEIETEYYNFTALNTPPDHPARDEQDTFYTNLGSTVVLRSHTSPVQIRAMEKHGVPLRVMTHGRVYRNEETNARKLPFFHQFEFLCVEEKINFSHLRWTIQRFLNELFQEEVVIRLRPDFFPFTEPSAEVDARCLFCGGCGCATCGQKGWLELMGCGLVDPNVLEGLDIDTERFSGFAGGIGIERIAMLKYAVSDIRNFFRGDVRFLEQFSRF
jgi:phenylalanyl-tRNA synthetase alpha chain